MKHQLTDKPADSKAGIDADDAAKQAAWQVLRPALGTAGWTVGDSCTYYGFFGWGWEARRQYDAQAAEIAALCTAGQQALEAMEQAHITGGQGAVDAASTALRQAMAQAVQPLSPEKQAMKDHLQRNRERGLST